VGCHTLRSLGIYVGSTIDVLVKDTYLICIDYVLWERGDLVLMVRASDTIDNIKDQIHEIKGIPAVHQKLLWYGRALVGEATLSEYNITAMTRLTLDI
jgi:hypothetical protein